MLVAKASNTTSLAAGLTYSICLVMLFAISAIYHRPNWSLKRRAFLRRLDHSAIYLLILGCFTPVCLIALPPESGVTLLKIVIGAVALGILKTIFWINAPKWFSSLVYAGVVAIFLPYLSELNVGLGMSNMILIWAGCTVYGIGAIFYAVKKPNFFPEIFGHHELFHACTVVAAFLHFIVMYRLIR